MARPSGREDDRLSTRGLWRVAVLVAASVVYTNVLTTYGFFLSSVGFVVICLPVFGVRHPVAIVAFALAVPAALVALFNHVLAMPLPTSPFTYYF